MNVDTELLITEVEMRRNLWDPSQENYKDRDLRTNAWQVICSMLIPHYDEMDGDAKKQCGKFQKLNCLF
jgi:hypothetical protein